MNQNGRIRISPIRWSILFAVQLNDTQDEDWDVNSSFPTSKRELVLDALANRREILACLAEIESAILMAGVVSSVKDMVRDFILAAVSSPVTVRKVRCVLHATRKTIEASNAD